MYLQWYTQVDMTRVRKNLPSITRPVHWLLLRRSSRNVIFDVRQLQATTWKESNQFRGSTNQRMRSQSRRSSNTQPLPQKVCSVNTSNGQFSVSSFHLLDENFWMSFESRHADEKGQPCQIIPFYMLELNRLRHVIQLLFYMLNKYSFPIDGGT